MEKPRQNICELQDRAHQNFQALLVKQARQETIDKLRQEIEKARLTYEECDAIWRIYWHNPWALMDETRERQIAKILSLLKE